MPRDKAHARMPKTRSKRGREAGPEHTVLEAHLLEAGEAGEEAGGEEAAAPKARRVGFDLGSAVEPEGGGSSGQPPPAAARAEPLGEAPQHGEGGGAPLASSRRLLTVEELPNACKSKEQPRLLVARWIEEHEDAEKACVDAGLEVLLLILEECNLLGDFHRIREKNQSAERAFRLLKLEAERAATAHRDAPSGQCQMCGKRSRVRCQEPGCEEFTHHHCMLTWTAMVVHEDVRVCCRHLQVAIDPWSDMHVHLS